MTGGIRLFVFGLGYSATAFARAMHGRADWIGGTVRTRDKADSLAAEGFETFIFDGRGPAAGVGDAVRRASHLLLSVAPGEAGDPVLAHHAADIAAAPDLRWVGYLSTVGVYGNYAGAWVSERTTPHPAHARAKKRLETEKAWAALAGERAAGLAVFRLAGIYGPGRNAFVNLAEGKAHRLIKPGQVFNRIHVDDIVGCLAAALGRSAKGIFNLADGSPAPPQDVVAYAAGLMGVPPPPDVPFDGAELPPLARSFYEENRRVQNRRIREDLAVALKYPTYRESLAAMWRDGIWRG